MRKSLAPCLILTLLLTGCAAPDRAPDAPAAAPTRSRLSNDETLLRLMAELDTYTLDSIRQTFDLNQPRPRVEGLPVSNHVRLIADPAMAMPSLDLIAPDAGVILPVVIANMTPALIGEDLPDKTLGPGAPSEHDLVVNTDDFIAPLTLQALVDGRWQDAQPRFDGFVPEDALQQSTRIPPQQATIVPGWMPRDGEGIIRAPVRYVYRLSDGTYAVTPPFAGRYRPEHLRTARFDDAAINHTLEPHALLDLINDIAQPERPEAYPFDKTDALTALGRRFPTHAMFLLTRWQAQPALAEVGHRRALFGALVASPATPLAMVHELDPIEQFMLPSENTLWPEELHRSFVLGERDPVWAFTHVQQPAAATRFDAQAIARCRERMIDGVIASPLTTRDLMRDVVHYLWFERENFADPNAAARAMAQRFPNAALDEARALAMQTPREAELAQTLVRHVLDHGLPGVDRNHAIGLWLMSSLSIDDMRLVGHTLRDRFPDAHARVVTERAPMARVRRIMMPLITHRSIGQRTPELAQPVLREAARDRILAEPAPAPLRPQPPVPIKLPWDRVQRR